MCFTIRHGKRWSSRDSRESRELQRLGQRLGSCNVSFRSRLGLGSEGLVYITVVRPSIARQQLDPRCRQPKYLRL